MNFTPGRLLDDISRARVVVLDDDTEFSGHAGSEGSSVDEGFILQPVSFESGGIGACTGGFISNAKRQDGALGMIGEDDPPDPLA